jgi:hypothetical protein
MFPGRLISHFQDITWPTRSPDLAVPDYFLWGCVKSKVYKTDPGNIADLKHWILECIQGIHKEMLQVVMVAFPLHLQAYWMTRWSHRKFHLNSNVWNEISWTWNAPKSVNRIFPLFLKKLFHLKNHKVFFDAPCICVHYIHVALCPSVLMWLPNITFCHNYSIRMYNAVKEKKMSRGWTFF